ncbi:MAG: hypothetical protein AAFP83_23900, partial [Bacteroidota bacterium]
MFWQAVDALDAGTENPFNTYIDQGSPGVQAFMRGRILSADELLKMVQERQADYEQTRNFEVDPSELITYYELLQKQYPYAVFPPIYFVMGRFNSAGTSANAGLVLGVEMLSEIESLPFLI